jgi:two-component system phosphate regulon response regulator PhoB/two-component system alkaline phosphatase synthesis response regulator PhoP
VRKVYSQGGISIDDIKTVKEFVPKVIKNEKILIGEDDKFLASAYRLKLTKVGFEIQIARDGEEVLKMLQTFTPDLILLDLVMPIKDGFAALEEIRANQSFKSIPILVASNLGQKEDIDRAMGLGANDFVVKSDLSLDELIKKINSML